MRRFDPDNLLLSYYDVGMNKNSRKVAKWRKENPVRSRESARRRARKHRGWAPGEHEKAEAALPFVTECGCCGNPEPGSRRGWNADHNHETGMFRGHLCMRCNTIVERIEKLAEKVFKYLKRS